MPIFDKGHNAVWEQYQRLYLEDMYYCHSCHEVLLELHSKYL